VGGDHRQAVPLLGLNSAANRFEDQVGSGQGLEEVAAQAGPIRAPAAAHAAGGPEGMARRQGQGPVGEAQAAFLIQRIDRMMDTLISRETGKAEEGLGSLAIVATASPFIGLFGTVWGIMHAFQNIAISKNTSLAVVAPSIAEALFATAIGLIAAIPAYIAYNKFSTDAGKYAGRLENFADDLSTAIQRRLSERV
jgi:biopolymer transport protein TolQ